MMIIEIQNKETVTLISLDIYYFLGLKNAIFGDLFYQKYCKTESENTELMFSVRMLELQLKTLKKKNEELVNRKDQIYLLLKNEFVKLVFEQKRVMSRLACIYKMLKDY